MRRKPYVRNCSKESVKGCTTKMFSRTLHAQQPVTKNLHISPRFSPTILYRDANSVLLLAHLCTAVLIASISYAQNLVFEIVYDEESVNIYLHTYIYNENVQQNPLCVESCVNKEFSISPRLSPTISDPDPNSSTPLYSSRLYA